MRKPTLAGIVAAGAIGAALAVGGVAYAAADPNSGGGEQIVRVVEDDCPDKGGSTEGAGDNL